MRRWIMFSGLIAVNVALAVLVVRAFRATPFDESRVAYGTSVADAAEGLLQQSTAGRAEDKKYLLIFVNGESLTRFRRRLQYINDLAPRVAGDKLQVVFVTDDPFEGLSTTATHARIYYDKKGTLHHSVHISPHHSHGGVVVLSQAGNVEFRVTTIAPEDEVRQLAEKYALGDINYRPASSDLSSLFSPGRQIPSVSPEPVSPAALRVPAFQPGHTVVMFAASCAPCVLNEYLADLGALKGRMAEQGGGDHLEVVFDSTFDRKMLQDQLQDPRVPALVYRADLRGLAAPRYETRTDALAVPMIVTVGADGRISSASALRLF